jgi:hypothetical protein
MQIALLALASVVLMPSVAGADATAFLGRTTAGDDRSAVRGFAFGVSLLVVGFEFEYANTTEDQTLQRPSLRTTSGNVFAQTFGLPGFTLYVTSGAGFYREHLGNDEESALVLNNGGGAKIKIGGPIRARIDYRIFNLRGNPRHKTMQRIYAGLNLSF